MEVSLNPQDLHIEFLLRKFYPLSLNSRLLYNLKKFHHSQNFTCLNYFQSSQVDIFKYFDDLQDNIPYNCIHYFPLRGRREILK